LGAREGERKEKERERKKKKRDGSIGDLPPPPKRDRRPCYYMTNRNS